MHIQQSVEVSTPTTRRGARVVGLCLLVLLTLLGWGLSGLPTARRAEDTATATGVTTVPARSQRGMIQQGLSTCDLLDLNCHLDELAQHLSLTIFDAIEPVLQSLQQNPGNFVSQTPPEVTYDNRQVRTVTFWFQEACLFGVAVVLVLNAYHLILAHNTGTAAPDLLELLPRVLLAFIASWLSLTLTQWLIDFNNALCADLISLYQFSLLSGIITNLLHIFTTPTAAANVLVLFVIGFVVAGLIFWLLWQMLVRLALVVVLIVLAPLGLFSFAFPLTARWGSLWLAAFSSTVLIQFVQITALVMGGLCATAFTDQHPFSLGLGAGGTDLLVGGAILFLVNQIPGMIREYALRPVAAAGQSNSQGVSANAAFGFVTRAISTILV